MLKRVPITSSCTPHLQWKIESGWKLSEEKSLNVSSVTTIYNKQTIPPVKSFFMYHKPATAKQRLFIFPIKLLNFSLLFVQLKFTGMVILFIIFSFSLLFSLLSFSLIFHPTFLPFSGAQLLSLLIFSLNYLPTLRVWFGHHMSRASETNYILLKGSHNHVGTVP